MKLPQRVSLLAAACLLAGLWPAHLPAQGPSIRLTWNEPDDPVALRQAVLDATTDTMALLVASHPDDRYVAPAAYLRFRRGFRVAILLATRGEGGQNGSGPEIGDELGWLRTLESEAGAALLDSRVWYLNRQDTGYCRTATEAIEAWGRQETLLAMARLLRTIRPDLVITTHHPEEDHGHDLALVELLPEAIGLAADARARIGDLPPIRLPRAFRGATGAESATAKAVLPLDEIDDLRRRTYRELGYAALRRHATQEPIRPMAELLDPVQRLYPLVPPADPPGWTLEGLPSLFQSGTDAPVDRAMEQSLHELGLAVDRLPEMLRKAIALHDRLRSLPLPPGSDADLRRLRRLAAIEQVILRGGGLRIAVEAPPHAVAVHGEALPMTVRVAAPVPSIFRNLQLAAVPTGELLVSDSAALAELAQPEPILLAAKYQIPLEPRSRRAWLSRLFHADTFDPPLRIACKVQVTEPTINHALELRFEIPVPVDVRPPLELECRPPAILLTRGRERQALLVRASRHGAAPLTDRLEVTGPPGFVVAGSPAAVQIDPAGVSISRFDLAVPIGLESDVYNVHIRLAAQRAVVSVHRVDAMIRPDLQIGLIRGVDDTAENVLAAFVGSNLHMLDETSLADRTLDSLDTVVVDIRALRERTDSSTWQAARSAFPRLLDFVRRGGRLVVLYHKDTEFNAETAGFVGAPFPLHIGKARVSREDAPIAMLAPEHELLTKPNRIRPEDWDGWVQERGLYLPDEWAPEYEAVLAMHDPDQPAERGALLYAPYGSGRFIYCALALYRQLDSLHPGAVRLFANLVSR